MRVNLFTATTVVALSLAVPVYGQDTSAETTASTMDEIRELVLYANYRDALSALSTYLGQPELTAAERNAALELMAVAQLATRDEEGRAPDPLPALRARSPASAERSRREPGGPGRLRAGARH